MLCVACNCNQQASWKVIQPSLNEVCTAVTIPLLLYDLLQWRMCNCKFSARYFWLTAQGFVLRNKPQLVLRLLHAA